MNIKRLVFWLVFVSIIGLIVWGLGVAMSRPVGSNLPQLGVPAPVTSADHIEGSMNAPVTLIEYGDFECPACGVYAPLVEKLMTDEASTTLRVVFRHFPLPQHLNAPIAAQASEAAAAQGKFWEMYRLLYAGQNDWANLSDAAARQVFDGYAKTLGLDLTKFHSDIDSTATKQFIQNEMAEGESLGIDYTPSFFVNGKLVPNPQSYEQFKALIDAAAR